MSATRTDIMDPVDTDGDGDDYFHITGSFEMETALCGLPLIGEMYVRDDDDEHDICPACESIHKLLNEKGI